MVQFSDDVRQTIAAALMLAADTWESLAARDEQAKSGGAAQYRYQARQSRAALVAITDGEPVVSVEASAGLQHITNGHVARANRIEVAS